MGTEDNTGNSKKVEIKDFFSKWFYIAVILLLIGLVLSSTLDVYVIENELFHYIITLLANLFQSVGLAIFISNIFTFIIGTNEFMDYIRGRLVNIVVSKDFITTLHKDEQHKLLHLTLKPPKDLSLLYSGINDYFDNYINQSMKLFENSYRGHLSINAVASYDKKKKCIQISYDMDYITYKVTDEYEPIKMYFEDSRSKHIETKINAPGMKTKVLEEEHIEDITQSIKDPSLKKGIMLKIPEEWNKHNHISMNRKLIEYGNDHWQSFSYKSIQPYDGMIINLRCEDNIVIRSFNLYGREDDFTVEEEKKNIKIQYYGWLTPGFGVNIIVAIDEHHYGEDYVKEPVVASISTAENDITGV